MPGSAEIFSSTATAGSMFFASRSRRARRRADSAARRVPSSAAHTRRSVAGSPPSFFSRAIHWSRLCPVVSASGASVRPSRRTSRARVSTPRARRLRANPRRALSRTGAGRSDCLSNCPKISEASEARSVDNRSRACATSSSAAGRRDCPRAAAMIASAVAGFSPVSSTSRSRRITFGSAGSASGDDGSRARTAARSPCSKRMRASRRAASGFSVASGSASLAASARLPCAAKAAARRRTASADPRSHGPSSVRRASAGRPAASCARASRMPSRCFSAAGALRSASCKGAMAACGRPSRMAAAACSSTLCAGKGQVDANSAKMTSRRIIFPRAVASIGRCGSPPRRRPLPAGPPPRCGRPARPRRGRGRQSSRRI